MPKQHGDGGSILAYFQSLGSGNGRVEEAWPTAAGGAAAISKSSPQQSAHDPWAWGGSSDDEGLERIALPRPKQRQHEQENWRQPCSPLVHTLPITKHVQLAAVAKKQALGLPPSLLHSEKGEAATVNPEDECWSQDEDDREGSAPLRKESLGAAWGKEESDDGDEFSEPNSGQSGSDWEPSSASGSSGSEADSESAAAPRGTGARFRLTAHPPPPPPSRTATGSNLSKSRPAAGGTMRSSSAPAPVLLQLGGPRALGMMPSLSRPCAATAAAAAVAEDAGVETEKWEAAVPPHKRAKKARRSAYTSLPLVMPAALIKGAQHGSSFTSVGHLLCELPSSLR